MIPYEKSDTSQEEDSPVAVTVTTSLLSEEKDTVESTDNSEGKGSLGSATLSEGEPSAEARGVAYFPSAVVTHSMSEGGPIFDTATVPEGEGSLGSAATSVRNASPEARTPYSPGRVTALSSEAECTPEAPVTPCRSLRVQVSPSVRNATTTPVTATSSDDALSHAAPHLAFRAIGASSVAAGKKRERAGDTTEDESGGKRVRLENEPIQQSPTPPKADVNGTADYAAMFAQLQANISHLKQENDHYHQLLADQITKLKEENESQAEEMKIMKKHIAKNFTNIGQATVGVHEMKAKVADVGRNCDVFMQNSMMMADGQMQITHRMISAEQSISTIQDSVAKTQDTVFTMREKVRKHSNDIEDLEEEMRDAKKTLRRHSDLLDDYGEDIAAVVKQQRQISQG